MTIAEPARVHHHAAWKALKPHDEEVKALHLAELFRADPARGATTSAEACEVYLDCSKNLVTHETRRPRDRRD